MIINGLKHLNPYIYDSIMIRNKKDNLVGEVKNNYLISTFKNSVTFYGGLKKLSDKEKVFEIIRYYLRKSRIYNIKKIQLKLF